MVALSFMGKKVHLVIRSTEMDDRRVLQQTVAAWAKKSDQISKRIYALKCLKFIFGYFCYFFEIAAILMSNFEFN